MAVEPCRRARRRADEQMVSDPAPNLTISLASRPDQVSHLRQRGGGDGQLRSRRGNTRAAANLLEQPRAGGVVEVFRRDRVWLPARRRAGLCRRQAATAGRYQMQRAVNFSCILARRNPKTASVPPAELKLR